METTKTNFKGMTIIHPHSGKVSRSIVSRCLNDYFGKGNVPVHGTAHLIDSNGEIRMDVYFEGQ